MRRMSSVSSQHITQVALHKAGAAVHPEHSLLRPDGPLGLHALDDRVDRIRGDVVRA